MKSLLWPVTVRLAGWCLCAVTILGAGCAHSRRLGDWDGAAMVPPKPPYFLHGPPGVLLTNTAGFSGHLVIESQPVASQVKPIRGVLLGKGGTLLFWPGDANQAKTGSHSGAAGFIWDVPAGQGYLLNEALQGYAPMTSPIRYTNVVVLPGRGNAASERIAGYSCVPSRVTVIANDGSSTEFQVWRAVELQDFPLRIGWTTNGASYTITFYNLRFENLQHELFLPPSGFTRYDSSEALMTELMVRQKDYRNRAIAAPPSGTGAEFDHESPRARGIY